MLRRLLTAAMHFFGDTDRLLPRDRSVLRRDVHQLLPEEQLQELRDVLHAGPVLPQLLLPSAGCMNDGQRPAFNPAAAAAPPEKYDHHRDSGRSNLCNGRTYIA